MKTTASEATIQPANVGTALGLAMAPGTTAEQLAEELRRSEVEERRAGAVVENPYAPREVPVPVVIETMLHAEFYPPEQFPIVKLRLEEALDTSEMTGRQANALERAERCGREAMKLLVSYKLWSQGWENDNRVVHASMRDAALRSLQKEKESGKRSKQITDADVVNELAAMHPDEWRAQEHRRARVELVTKSLEHLVESWSSKCRSLQALVGKGR